MAEEQKLVRTWVEVREESGPDRIVLRPLGANIPPTRGGRRWLQLGPGGVSSARSPGPTDRMEGASGTWSVEGDDIRVTAPSWTGDYTIETLEDDLLVLRRK